MCIDQKNIYDYLLSLVAASFVLTVKTLATFLRVLRFSTGRNLVRGILVQEEERVGEGSEHVLGKTSNKWWIIIFSINHHLSKLISKLKPSHKLLQYLSIIHSFFYHFTILKYILLPCLASYIYIFILYMYIGCFHNVKAFFWSPNVQGTLPAASPWIVISFVLLFRSLWT